MCRTYDFSTYKYSKLAIKNGRERHTLEVWPSKITTFCVMKDRKTMLTTTHVLKHVGSDGVKALSFHELFHKKFALILEVATLVIVYAAIAYEQYALLVLAYVVLFPLHETLADIYATIKTNGRFVPAFEKYAKLRKREGSKAMCYWWRISTRLPDSCRAAIVKLI